MHWQDAVPSLWQSYGKWDLNVIIPSSAISWGFLTLIEKLEATILLPAVLISHRKSFQGTMCMSTGKCCIVRWLETWYFITTSVEFYSKVNETLLTKIEAWRKYLQYSMYSQVTLQCGLSDGAWGLICAWRPCRTHYICKPLPRNGFSDAAQGLSSFWRFCRIRYTDKVPLHCEFFDVWWGLSSGWRLFHTHYTHRVSLHYVFSDGLSALSSAWKLFHTRYIRKVFLLYEFAGVW